MILYRIYVYCLLLCMLEPISTVVAAASVIKPTAAVTTPSNIVCAMTVCPTSTAQQKRDSSLECPANCSDNCEIINDVCCPGVQRAVCKKNDNGDSTVTAPSTQVLPTVSVTTTGLKHSSDHTSSSSTTVSNTASIPSSTAAGAATATSQSSSVSATKWAFCISGIVILFGTCLLA